MCTQFRIASKFKVSRNEYTISHLIPNYSARYHIVEEFNKGVYEYIIATDEGSGSAEQDTDEEGEDAEECE